MVLARKGNRVNDKRPAGIAGCIIPVILMVVTAVSCGALPRPMIDYVPADWALFGLTPYEEGVYQGEYNDQSGLIEYSNQVTFDGIQIFYEPAPKPDLTLSDLEYDADYIFQRDLGYVPDETGVMVVAGAPAGYARGYYSDSDTYELEVIVVLDNLYLDVYAAYSAPEAGDQILDMIDSISM
jgi:hypothetical protein